MIKSVFNYYQITGSNVAKTHLTGYKTLNWHLHSLDIKKRIPHFSPRAIFPKKMVYKFLHDPARKHTNIPTNADQTITPLSEVNNNITPAHGTSTDFRLPLRESVQSDLAEPKYTAWNDRRTPFPAHRYADIRDVTEFGVGFIFKSDGLWRFSCNPTNSLKDYGQNRNCFVARCELKCCTVTSAMNAGIDNLKTRREHLTEQFFLRNVLNEKSSLHYLLPNKRDVNIVNRLHHAKTLELSQTRTERFIKSFIAYSLAHFH